MGYNKDFIHAKTVELPEIKGALKSKIAPLLNSDGHVIDYLHHSLVMNKERKFAFYTASNINGKSWKAINRKGSFKKDETAVSPDLQLGQELYDAIKASHL